MCGTYFLTAQEMLNQHLVSSPFYTIKLLNFAIKSSRVGPVLTPEIRKIKVQAFEFYKKDIY